ncbi:MAG: sulfatase [Halobacteriaceae archaeon]
MPRPNVVFVHVDDLGWRDIGCYGSPFYETPNVDRLAREGTRFTDAYAAAPVCSPTRASVMSGQYPARVGVTDWIDPSGSVHPCSGRLVDAPYVDHLPADQTSLAQVLSDAGYQTWHVGKWHLGGEEFWPGEHGFDENVAGCEMGSPYDGYFSPWNIPTLEDGPEGEYLTDRLTDEAVSLVEERDEDAPFFLHLCFYTVHTPIQPKEREAGKYRQKREALGLDDVEEFEEGDFFPAEHKRDQRIRRRLVQSDPEYAAMVQHMDDAVGRVLDALEREGVEEETLVVFTSDNGGLATAEGSPTCNDPLSEGKGWMYEGGTRVPLIVRWPGVTEADDVCREPVTSPDYYPTICDAAGADVPGDQTVDGESLRPLFEGGDLDRDAVFWHYPHYGNQGGTPGASVREGDWKLIWFFEDDHVELYDLRADVREEEDLSDDHPERAERLRRRIEEWQEDVAAELPRENPDFEPWQEDPLVGE